MVRTIRPRRTETVAAAVALLLLLVAHWVACGQAVHGAATTDRSPTTRSVLRPIHSVFETTVGFRSVITISPEGRVRRVEAGPGLREAAIAEGVLTDDQVQELATAFERWSELRPAYAREPEDPRTVSLTYGDQTVVAGPRSEAPQQFMTAWRAVTRAAVRQASPDVPMAKADDLRLGVIKFPPIEGATTRPGEAGRSGVLAFVMNKSDRAVRVYVPSFIGPIASDGREAIEENRVGAMFGPHDFVCLRPNEAFSRTFLGPVGNRIFYAQYMLFTPGLEGEYPAEGVIRSSATEIEGAANRSSE
jgi:hypothetical protein